MRIVFDARESGTTTGRYMDKLVEYLHKLKPEHEIILLAYPHRIEFYKQIAPSFRVVETKYKEFTFGEQLGFKKQIESLKADLVHFPMVQQPAWYKGAVVTTIQDLTTTRFRNPSKNWFVFTVKRWVYRWLVKHVCKKSRHIIVPTEFVKKDLMNYTGTPESKITVTLEAADKIQDEARPVEQLKNEQFIMYVGRPLPHKNLGRLIEAHQILLETMPNLKLVLVGKKDPIYQGYEAEVIKRGLKNIVFTGFIEDAQLRWLYEHTACYVFPSLSEGFGLPPLEAMNHGAPVASSNATCLPEVNGPAAKYFDPKSSRGMAAAISDVINDKALNQKLRELGARQIKKYSWERMAKATFDIYKRVLSL